MINLSVEVPEAPSSGESGNCLGLAMSGELGERLAAPEVSGSALWTGAAPLASGQSSCGCSDGFVRGESRNDVADGCIHV